MIILAFICKLSYAAYGNKTHKNYKPEKKMCSCIGMWADAAAAPF